MTRSALLRESLETIPWSLWAQQIKGIVRVELKRSLFTRRSLFVYLLALAPVALLTLRWVAPVPEKAIDGLGGSSVLYAVVYRTFFLRLSLFFGCVGVFMRLFRSEVLERTLHLYLLTPVRREVIVVGKYLSGLMIAVVLFVASTVISYLVLFIPSGGSSLEESLFRALGMGHLLAYVGITMLACVGYGAVFQLMGLFFKNPIIPVAVVLGWEYINFLLPPFLKKLSVIFYLESLCPVPIPIGLFTLFAEPASFWLAVPGLLGFTLLMLFLAAVRFRRIEVFYGDD